MRDHGPVFLPSEVHRLRDLAEREREGRRPRVTPRRLRPRCGARTRTGAPCKRLPVWDNEHDRPRNGRCPNHGGLSTGPKTPEGLRRRSEGYRRYVERRREEQQ
jgi:hypothetical protein